MITFYYSTTKRVNYNVNMNNNERISAKQKIEEAKKAALDVLLHNAHGPIKGLPRTAGWGYPEPYTRDLMLSLPGIAVSGNQVLLESARKVLQTLAENQTEHGHIPSLVHDKGDRGASDATPLFLLGVGIFRMVVDEPDFLQKAVDKALTWMDYQSPSDRYLVAQQPTSDWRDEQWVLGYGLYVNAVVYSYLRLLGRHERADKMLKELGQHTADEGLAIEHKPYYALWTYKTFGSERFDLLGNSLAILSGIAPPSQAQKIVLWVEKECQKMKKEGLLAFDLPPNFFPFIQPQDTDWRERYASYNKPGEYHNGGIWPFICSLYVAALVAAEKFTLAEKKLTSLTQAVALSNNHNVDYGFNEWLKAQNGEPMGQDWQTWSAALYLYAAACVEKKQTPFFGEIRNAEAEIAQK
jgi:glycogen debranching enzyme